MLLFGEQFRGTAGPSDEDVQSDCLAIIGHQLYGSQALC